MIQAQGKRPSLFCRIVTDAVQHWFRVFRSKTILPTDIWPKRRLVDRVMTTIRATSLTVDQMPVDQMPVGEMPVGEMDFYEMTWSLQEGLGPLIGFVSS